jgi:hypothetical protein
MLVQAMTAREWGGGSAGKWAVYILYEKKFKTFLN